MIRHFFTFLFIVSIGIFSAFACEHQEGNQNFFPQKFTEGQLEELMNDKKRGFKDRYKQFYISKEDRDILYQYSPSKAQVITGPSFPHRVEKIVEKFFLKNGEYKYKAEYEIKPAYSYFFVPVKITITGDYDVLRTILPGESLDNNTLCLHRLRDLLQEFVSQTPHQYRFNITLAKLFYTLKVLEKDDSQQAIYHQANKEDYINLAYMILNQYMKADQITPEIRIKILDREQESLKPEFYEKAFTFLKTKIYAKLHINESILETLYSDNGLFSYTEKYNEAVRQAGLEKATN